jgi:hypothetical protein
MIQTANDQCSLFWSFAKKNAWRAIKPLAAVMFFLAVVQPTAAADMAAQFLTKLFTDVCVPNLGQPSKVREWAEQRHLGQIQNPTAVRVFVGGGENGAAWAIAAAEGNFVLSIRGMTQACAVWAQAANAEEVMINFKRIIEGVKRPGIAVTVDKDTVSSSPVGNAHVLVYNVAAPNAPTSFEFTMLTAERPGGAFQASLQAAKAGTH